MAPFEYDKLVFIGFFAALRMTSVYWNKQLLGKIVYRNCLSLKKVDSQQARNNVYLSNTEEGAVL